jgi:hypothetical protein
MGDNIPVREIHDLTPGGASLSGLLIFVNSAGLRAVGSVLSLNWRKIGKVENWTHVNRRYRYDHGLPEQDTLDRIASTAATEIRDST